jgi:hypothetical protein
MALTLAQLKANLDAVNSAIGDPTLRVRFPDGREVMYRTIDELRKAKAEIEEDRVVATGLGVRIGTEPNHRCLRGPRQARHRGSVVGRLHLRTKPGNGISGLRFSAAPIYQPWRYRLCLPGG